MNLIMTMRFMKNPLNFQVLLQQSCLVDGGLKATCSIHWATLFAVAGNKVA